MRLAGRPGGTPLGRRRVFPRFSTAGREGIHSRVLTVGSLLALCAPYPEHQFQPGDVLLAEGGRSGLLYVLETGTIEVEKSGYLVSRTSQPGSVFGEIGVLLDHPHIATVRAMAPSRCRIIEDPLAFLGAHPEAALHLAMLLAQRLTGAMSQLVDLRRDHRDRQEHLAMVDKVLGTLLHLQPQPRPAAGMPRPGA